MTETSPRTHLRIDHRLCGRPTHLGTGEARVTLELTPEMAVDDRGLVHGGFVFGLADHAAMLAVNDPLVVLGESTCRFQRPVSVGQTVVARAIVRSEQGRKRHVEVEVLLGEEPVMTGQLTCFVLERHVLDRD